MANNDVGSPIQCPWFGDKSVHLRGTFGAGGTVKLQGSNDTAGAFSGTTACILRDPASVALSFTTEDIKQVLENPNWIRPIITGGDGTTAITCLLLCRPGTRTL